MSPKVKEFIGELTYKFLEQSDMLSPHDFNNIKCVKHAITYLTIQEAAFDTVKYVYEKLADEFQ